jgi:hypothetical protein
VDKKVPAVVVAGCSVAPPKARRKRASRKEKAKDIAGDTASPAICPSKLNLWNLAKGKEKLPKVLPMLGYKRLLVS